MKFTIVPILLFLFFTIPGFTQLQLAPITGLNISNIRNSKNLLDEVSYSYTNGFMGGLNAKYGFDDKFNLQLEGAYSQKGFESQAKNIPGRNILHLNYLDFLLIGEYALNDIIALNIGGNFGIKINEKINGSINSRNEGFSSKDIGLIAGLKFYIGQLFIRTSYQHGLNPLFGMYFTDENGMTTGQADVYNQTFQVAVGYYFPEPYNVFKR